MNRRVLVWWSLIVGPAMLVGELLGWDPSARRWLGESRWGSPQPLSRVWWHPVVTIAAMWALFALAEAYHRWSGGDGGQND